MDKVCLISMLQKFPDGINFNYAQAIWSYSLVEKIYAKIGFPMPVLVQSTIHDLAPDLKSPEDNFLLLLETRGKMQIILKKQGLIM